MALLQGLTYRVLRVEGSQPGMLVDIGGNVAQRGQIGQTRKRARHSHQGGQHQIVDDSTILLKLRQGVHLHPCSENRTICNEQPGSALFSIKVFPRRVTYEEDSFHHRVVRSCCTKSTSCG